MVAVFDLLADNPKIARERTEFNPPVRLHSYQAHLIVYIENADEILVIRVLHRRQDWQRYLSQEYFDIDP